MTDLILRTLARKRLSTLARPSAVMAFAIAIAYGGGLWLTFLHHVEGGHERNEPPFVLHWLRDATLALPLIFMGVWVGVVLARKLIARAGATDGPVALCAAVLAAVVALTATIAVGATGPAHGNLFGAQHGGHELPFLMHLGRDMLVALCVNLMLCGAVSAAIFRRRPWAVPDVQSWLSGRFVPRQRLALNSALGLLLVLPVVILAASGAEKVTAQAGAGTPCPVGVPLKTYDVQALDVDITLNRFGDHDPEGKMYVLSDEVDRVRQEEAARKASIGLRKDAIQPLVIRANIGDCVEINFANNASGGDYGIHIDGLAFDAQNSGDAVGNNVSSAVARGDNRTYRFYVPEDETFEGSHYLRPGPGHRSAVSHGLFGALVVEPRGSTYLAMDDLSPVKSGWEAVIKPEGKKSFREYVQLYHEIGDEDYRPLDSTGAAMPRVDPHSESYRPGARAMNYRSEPFMNRMNNPGSEREEAHGYGSYTFGDPATVIPRGYQGDPTKIRILHAGAEVFHVFHLHGGGIRWRLNPKADPNFDYQNTGLNKHPQPGAPSTRLDSQAFGPGESFELEIEGGAGGVQQGAGEFLFHCHIVEHYVSGMWGFWRVFDTRQPGLAPLPDRVAPPNAVESSGLIGKTINGTAITAANLDDWIRPQLPPQGVRQNDQDASVWDWKVDTSNPAAPVYAGEPEDLSSWPDYTKPSDAERLDGHPSLLAGDRPIRLDGEGVDRPKLLFNPNNGRPAFPLLRPHLGKRPPFSPNGHSGAPWLGETGSQPKNGATDPWANRADGICPATAPVRTFNIVTINPDLNVTKNVRHSAQIFVLAQDADEVLAGTKPVEPLAIRANIGDCVAVTLTNRIPDTAAFNGLSKHNLHIHHVQFDTQASDGVITGLSYEQAVEDYPSADPTLTADAGPGSRTLHMSSVAKFQPGVAIAVSQGQESIEVRTIESIDEANLTLTLTQQLNKDHLSGEHAGTEFVQSRWYPDVQMDNVFWHDHVDGIHGWPLGLVGQLIVEPTGSTYHDPKTGAIIKSGTLADIHTNSPLAEGQINGDFRELALWEIDDNPVSDSTLNLRSEPWADRLSPVTGNPDPSLLFSSWTHGDPNTPLPRAYQGDPLAIRTINVGPAIDGLKVDGHRFFRENRFLDGETRTQASPTDSIHYGVSERYTAILDGGAGGPEQRTGDFVYFNSLGRRFRQGAWGLLRVLPRQVGDLQPLPDHPNVPTGGTPVPTPTGGRPPAPGLPGSPCPASATTRTVDVSAIDLANPRPGVSSVFVQTSDAAAVRNGTKAAEPLIVHIAAGECLEVNFTNERATARASFHVSELLKTTASSGINAGFNPEQTLAPSGTRTYRFYADTRKIGAAMISDFGGIDTGIDGLYGAVVVAPSGARFSNPDTGAPVRVGEGVDVNVPGQQGYRDFTTIMSENDPIIGGNFMPYPVDVAGHATINYRTVPRGDDNAAFSSRANGDPSTPLMRAYAGDPVKVHALVAPGSEQSHVFGLGGQSWRIDPEIAQGNETTAQGMVAWEAFDLDLIGGAGGRQRETGDYFYGDVRRPFTQAGMWGLMRVMSDPACPIRPLDGLSCIGQKSAFTGLPPRPAGNPGDAPAPADPPAAGQPPAAAPAPAATPPATAPAPKPLSLRGLSVSRRMSLSTLAKQGLTFQVTLPANARALQMKLTRRSGKKTITIATRNLIVRSGGRRTVTWKLTRAQLRRMKAGDVVLSVRAGTSSKKLAPATLKATIRFSGRLPRLR
ncbi:MAG TPA: multicopper oxidase domain-containing protein [Solirubrobacteraceae bacterium]|nr:multicopper oxidase domain-containing protein [Solirubrobacteraceae bacterium]